MEFEQYTEDELNHIEFLIWSEKMYREQQDLEMSLQHKADIEDYYEFISQSQY